MTTREQRRAEFAKLRDWGVKGVKVDFWQSDKQDRIRQYRDLLRDAAEFHLLVDFHGCTLPRGWSREFPNLVTMEAVFGAEQYKARVEMAEGGARHNTILPFTRNVVGSMDYTPVTFSDAKFPHRTTTRTSWRCPSSSNQACSTSPTASNRTDPFPMRRNSF